MPFLTHDTVSLYYELHGTHGPPLVLTHGYSSTSAMWRPNIPALSASHRLLIWDMRGHGSTTSPTSPAAYSEAATLSDMHLLLTTLFPQDTKFIVGGLSLGGYMSLAFHHSYPQMVSALLIISTGPGFRSPSAREAWNETALATARRFETEGLASLAHLSPERATVTHKDTSGRGLALAARGMLTQHTSRVIEGLGGVKVPSLVVVGSEDRAFLAAGEYMQRKIGGCERVVLKGAGHACNMDDVRGFDGAVVGFLGRCGLGGGGKEGKARL